MAMLMSRGIRCDLLIHLDLKPGKGREGGLTRRSLERIQHQIHLGSHTSGPTVKFVMTYAVKDLLSRFAREL